MKVTVVEGTPHEVSEYLKLIEEPAPAAVTPPAYAWSDRSRPNMDVWQVDEAKFEAWAEERMASMNIVFSKNGETHGCNPERWERKRDSLVLICEHDGHTQRIFPNKILRRKEQRRATPMGE